MRYRSTRAGTSAPRRGFSMIEVLVLVTCVSIVLALAATTIQLMLRLYSDGQARLSSALVLDRLGRQLRADAHDSEKAQLDGNGGKARLPRTILKLSPEPGRDVTYKVLAQSVDRDESLAGKRVRHESFVLPRGRQARFELGTEAGRAMVSLLLDPSPGSRAAGSQRSLEVLAVLGKHRSGSKGKNEGSKQ